MTTLISPQLAIVYLIIFGLAMIAVTFLFGKRLATTTVEGFLVADRRVPWWLGGPSIAASWAWAMAMMVSTQYAYDYGLAGSFWFIIPNVIALLVFVWLGPQIRKRLPNGYSLPEWIHFRFGDKNLTTFYLIFYLYYQVMAVAVQVWAGAQLLNVASGISPMYLMPALLAVALMYTLISGLAASVVTDFLQFLLMMVCGATIVAMVVFTDSVQMSFTGVVENGGFNPFLPALALTVGITTSIGLISGSIADQQCWQRSFALRDGQVRSGFLFGSFLFFLIPATFSFLGYVAAAPSAALDIPADFDHSLVGFVVASKFLPAGIATIFVFVLLAGISSTLDSGLTATSTLSALIRKKYWIDAKLPKEEMSINFARRAMLIIGFVGLAIGYGVELIPGFQLKYLWWLFNTLAACMVIPTVLSLFWPRVTERGILIGSGTSLIVGVPIVFYGSIIQNDYVVTAANVGVLVFCTAACVITAAPRYASGREE